MVYNYYPHGYVLELDGFLVILWLLPNRLRISESDESARTDGPDTLQNFALANDPIKGTKWYYHIESLLTSIYQIHSISFDSLPPKDLVVHLKDSPENGRNDWKFLFIWILSGWNQEWKNHCQKLTRWYFHFFIRRWVPSEANIDFPLA